MARHTCPLYNRYMEWSKKFLRPQGRVDPGSVGLVSFKIPLAS